MVSLCSPGCPGTCSVDEAGRGPPASHICVMGLKAYTTAQSSNYFLKMSKQRKSIVTMLHIASNKNPNTN